MLSTADPPPMCNYECQTSKKEWQQQQPYEILSLPYLSSHVSNLSWQSPIRGRPISQSSIPPTGSSISSPSALLTPACCDCNSSAHRYNPPPTQKIIAQRQRNYFTPSPHLRSELSISPLYI